MSTPTVDRLVRAVLERVSKLRGVSIERILSESRQPDVSLARQMVAHALATDLHLSHREIGDYLHRSASSVCTMLQRFSQKEAPKARKRVRT